MGPIFGALAVCHFYFIIKGLLTHHLIKGMGTGGGLRKALVASPPEEEEGEEQEGEEEARQQSDALRKRNKNKKDNQLFEQLCQVSCLCGVCALMGLCGRASLTSCGPSAGLTTEQAINLWLG